MGPPWWIDPTADRTMSERSYHGATSRSVLSSETLLFLFSYLFIFVFTIVGLAWRLTENENIFARLEEM